MQMPQGMPTELEVARENAAIADLLFDLVNRPDVERMGERAFDLLMRVEQARRLARAQVERTAS